MLLPPGQFGARGPYRSARGSVAVGTFLSCPPYAAQSTPVCGSVQLIVSARGTKLQSFTPSLVLTLFSLLTFPQHSDTSYASLKIMQNFSVVGTANSTRGWRIKQLHFETVLLPVERSIII